jgi:hypothetical protein
MEIEMKSKRTTAARKYLLSIALTPEALTAEILAQIMIRPPVTAHADIDPNAFHLLLTTTDRNQGLRVRSCARRALEAAGWDLDEYRGHPSTSHVVFHDGRNYLMTLTERQELVA